MADETFGFGLKIDDLYSRDGLVRLDAAFLDHLKTHDLALFNRLMAGRAAPDALDAKAHAQLLIDLGGPLEDFCALLFGIRRELAALQRRHHALAPLYQAKRLFVQRRAAKAYTAEQAEAFDAGTLEAAMRPLLGWPVDELRFAQAVVELTATPETEAANHGVLRDLETYAAWALYSAAGRARHADGVLFKQPHKLDFDHLVPVATETIDGVARMAFAEDHWRQRRGFALTDHGTDLTGALDQANYCIWCHHQERDSCSHGLKDKAGGFKQTAFGINQAGCPLEERISEMHELKAAGLPLAALAMITLDNPMCAATGHRICNDCMKSCIYQKQEPVDIPQAETRSLKDILALPWGFEIYSLLTRWNPLNLSRPLPRPDSGYKVLVVGLGPAGFTLAHHLMNDGHTVVAIDGLKIEPLAPQISGVDALGRRVPFDAIHDAASLREDLGSRVLAGFGGVAEYGITVRWDKNFLKLIRLLLERRRQFAMIGGVRFGGTITMAQAFAAGFDHIALCMGAGRPTVLAMPNGLVRGVRQASDFLMALQLTGAARPDSLANLQVRLPVVVVGGGLTAIDTATESLAFYPVQVEKFLARYERLVAALGEAETRAAWSEEDSEIADTFIAHAKAIRAEHAAAARDRRAPDLVGLLRGWGGATVAYRRRLIDAPSYTLNHEEIAKAMEEGITFIENVTPHEVVTDRFGAAAGLVVQAKGSTHVTLPAKTILIAAGTQPNTVLARENTSPIAIDGKYFQAYGEDGTAVSPERVAKPDTVQVLMHFEDDGRCASFFGDLHPSFAGNVVKAMGGAKQGYPVISRMLARVAPTAIDGSDLIAAMNDGLRARIHAVNRLTPTIVEIVVEAPYAARAFEPGQFYRLQNFEALAARVDGTVLAMEGLALTGASTDAARGLVSTIVLEMGGSSELCRLLKPGEPVVLMGPTGMPTETPAGEAVMLVGGGLGNAVLFSIGQAVRAGGGKVLYFAGYKKLQDRYRVAEIERAADLVVWCSDEAPGFQPSRPGDLSFTGNIVEAMVAYAEGRLGPKLLDMSAVKRVIAIGSDRMMAAVARARHGVLKPHLGPDHTAIGSINSPMQCMMKEICAQCLQRHLDPLTGEEHVVFSCANQDQDLDRVDWANLNDRLSQNALQEKLTRLWIARCLASLTSQPAAE